MEHIYLDFKENQQGDVMVLSITGKMMGGPDTQEVHNRIKTYVAKGIKKIVINFESVKWLSSSGIGTLVACLNTVQREGGQLRLANLSGKDEGLFLVTNLIKVFEHHKSVGEAIAAFSA